MNLEPKIEPGSPSSNPVILDRDEDDEVGAYPMETLDLEGMTSSVSVAWIFTDGNL